MSQRWHTLFCTPSMNHNESKCSISIKNFCAAQCNMLTQKLHWQRERSLLRNVNIGTIIHICLPLVQDPKPKPMQTNHRQFTEECCHAALDGNMLHYLHLFSFNNIIFSVSSMPNFLNITFKYAMCTRQDPQPQSLEIAQALLTACWATFLLDTQFRFNYTAKYYIQKAVTLWPLALALQPWWQQTQWHGQDPDIGKPLPGRWCMLRPGPNSAALSRYGGEFHTISLRSDR
jgi:hypothetical protein